MSVGADSCEIRCVQNPRTRFIVLSLNAPMSAHEVEIFPLSNRMWRVVRALPIGGGRLAGRKHTEYLSGDDVGGDPLAECWSDDHGRSQQ